MKDQGRFYPIEIQPTTAKYWSVTTILSLLEKPALVQWAANCACKHFATGILTVPQEVGSSRDEYTISTSDIDRIWQEAKNAHRNIKQEAADTGTQVHDAIEAWASDSPWTASVLGLTTSPLFQGYSAFTSWAESVKLLPLASEIKVWSNLHRYAGRFDMLCTMQQGRQRKPRTYLIDVKTSSGVYPLEMGMQLAAYVHAYNECCGDKKIDGCGIIRCDKKTGVPEWWDATEQLTLNWERFKSLANLYYLIKGDPQ